MASKNPIKGYIACPTQGCGAVCTVHAVGEHKIIDGGDPPKNKRRLGQLYTICPNCKTNQSSGKPFQDWLSRDMVDTPDEVSTGYIYSSGKKPHLETKNKPNETTATTTEKPANTRLAWVFLGLLGSCGLLWMVVSGRKKSGDDDES